MDLGKRIMVLGSSGSGKSTMAVRLSALTGLPVVHLDRLSWNPGWVATPGDVMAEKIIAAADQPLWIIDGNYFGTGTREYRLERANTVVYLDFNRYLCLFRAFKRWIKNYGRTRSDLGEGCPEKMDAEFIKWIWGYPRRSRGRALLWLAAIKPPKQVYHLRGNKAVKRFFRDVSDSYAARPV